MYQWVSVHTTNTVLHKKTKKHFYLRGQLFENRLMLNPQLKLTEVFILLIKIFLKARFQLTVKKTLSQDFTD